MRHWSRLLTATVASALLLAAAVGTASANRLLLSNQNLTITWSVAKIAIPTSSVEIRCRVQLEGSFHSRSISKVSGALIGHITEAGITQASCVRNGITVALFLRTAESGVETLPWHIRYDSFTGRLPRIEGVRIQIIGLSLQLNVGGMLCLYASTPGLPLYATFGIEEGGTVTKLRFLETAGIPKTGGMLCPEPVIFQGDGTVVLRGTTNAIRITLVA